MEPDRDDDALLVAAADDPEAFAQFYRLHVRGVIAYFRRRVGNAELAADLTAETFAAALAGRRRFAPERGPAAAWLYGIARRQLVTFQRRGHVERRARRRLGMARIELTDEMLERVEAVADAELAARRRRARRAARRPARGRPRTDRRGPRLRRDRRRAVDLRARGAPARLARARRLARPHEEPGAMTDFIDVLEQQLVAAHRGRARRAFVAPVAHHHRLRRRGGRGGRRRGRRPGALLAGAAARREPADAAAADHPGDAAAPVSLAVLNGTKITGLARGVADELTSLGYPEPNLVTNDPTNQSRARTTVYYQGGHRADALGVASCLHIGSDRVVPMDADARALADRADVAVFVGADRAR